MILSGSPSLAISDSLLGWHFVKPNQFSFSNLPAHNTSISLVSRDTNFLGACFMSHRALSVVSDTIRGNVIFGEGENKPLSN